MIDVMVRDLHVRCMFKLRHLDSPVTCASDCCLDSADSWVEVSPGKVLWRCQAHRGMIDDTRRGRIGFTVKRKGVDTYV